MGMGKGENEFDGMMGWDGMGIRLQIAKYLLGWDWMGWDWMGWDRIG